MRNYWALESVKTEWFDENDVNIQSLLESKSKAYIALSKCVTIVFKIINLHIADNVFPESQCGFRSSRRTVDMIFTIRHLQEKCLEQRKDLFEVFIDLTKTFDTVNRESLWLILGKLSCPEKLISILKLFHHDMKTTLNIGGKLAELFTVGNGVKQGDTLAPKLFALYFSMMFQLAFKVSSEGVYI